jgi:hypothetical protein
MEPIKTTVKSGKYTFQITDNTLLLRDQIYSRNFKIGGKSSDCVHVSISYKDNVPVSASIPHLLYEPECSMETPLDRGQGSVAMIKTLLRHIHAQIPSITHVNFEDKSNIECANDIEIQKKGSRFRKMGTNVYPIPLYYFSIAFNGETWYEKHFRARQTHHHEKYKERIHTLLYLPGTKAAMSFRRFLEIAKPPVHILEELQSYYERASTFDKFFNHIPKVDRCRLVRDWISAFMEHYLNGVFTNIDWVIDLPIVSSVGGGKTCIRRYYCPKGRVLRNGGTQKTFLVDAMDI